MNAATLHVSIHKAHLSTIGEKLYGESLELIRELVSNAYDADATKIGIELQSNRIVVSDDGSGMDEEGLREYFNIGSQNKQVSRISPLYRRIRIGQFGIGKFAVLSACARFRIRTQKDGYAAEVTFDKQDWQSSEAWEVPIERQIYDETQGNGTTVILDKLIRSFTPLEVERFIRERLPLSAPHFEVYLNDKRVEPVYIAGQRFTVMKRTSFGLIHGEIIAPNFRQKITDQKVGIEVTVNGVVIKRETFDGEMEAIFSMYKLVGRVAADFVPITSDRSRFITDSPHYEEFSRIMRRELNSIARHLNEYANLKGKQKADETLKSTMSRLGRAIRKNPAFSPQIMSATGEIDETASNSNSLAPQAQGNDEDSLEALKLEFPLENWNKDEKIEEKNDDEFPNERISKVKKVRVKNLAGKMLVARRIRIGGLGIVCNVDSFGREERPVFTDSGIIYINQDHPLYKKQAKEGKENLSFYLAYLLSQQIALLVSEKDPHKAFAIQNKLLSDCF